MNNTTIEGWELPAERILMDYADGAESFATSMNKIHKLISSTLSTLVKEMEGREITYEKGLEMCGCEQKYSCNFKKGYNQGISAAVEVVKKMGVKEI